MNNQTVTNQRRDPNRNDFLADFAPRFLLGALFLILVCYTGTLIGAYTARPHETALLGTIFLLVLLCVWPSSRRDNAPRVIVALWRRYERLPVGVLVPLALWLLFGLLAMSRSTLHDLSQETFGSYLWMLLLAALIYSYGARGPLQVRRLAAAMIVSLDAALAFGFWQYFHYWFLGGSAHDNSFHAQHFAVYGFMNDTNQFGHYLVLLLPLALWDTIRAARTLRSGHSSTRRKRHNADPATQFWTELSNSAADLQRNWTLWRTLRPGLMLGLAVACSSRSCWLGCIVGIACFAALSLHRARAAGRERTLGQFTTPFHAAIILALVFTALIVVQQHSWLSMRLASTVKPSDFGHEGRGSIYRNALRMATRRPLLGWGQGTFGVNYPISFRPTDYREAVLQAHDIYLNRLMEEGLPALLCWAAFAFGIWRCGLLFLLRRREPEGPDSNAAAAAAADIATAHGRAVVTPADSEELMCALLAGLLAYFVTGLFVIGEQMPNVTVHFYAFLALILAIAAEAEARGVNTAGKLYASGGAIKLARVVAACGAVAFLSRCVSSDHLPFLDRATLWETLQAQAMFDDAVSTKLPADRIWLLRGARDLDPDQPIYWGELARARYLAGGRTALATASYLYRAAAHRAKFDATWYHNTAMMYLLSGDAKLLPDAVKNELSATKYDPTYAFYQATLADAYDLMGDRTAADERRARARKFASPPVVHDPIDPDPQEAEELYFGGVDLPRYRRVVPHGSGSQLIKVPGSTMAESLAGTIHYPTAHEAALQAAQAPTVPADTRGAG